MVNVAFFAACTTEELVNAPDSLALFFEKVFGPSDSAHVASAIVISLSAAGAMLSLTFANVRVKQEIARNGLVPAPEFWSKTSHRRTPAHALVLHWIFSVVCVTITPLNNADGFLIMSTFYSYVHTWISSGFPDRSSCRCPCISKSDQLTHYMQLCSAALLCAPLGFLASNLKMVIGNPRVLRSGIGFLVLSC